MSGNADLMKAYNRYLRLQRGYSPNTLEAYQRDVKKLFDFLGCNGVIPLTRWRHISVMSRNYSISSKVRASIR